ELDFTGGEDEDVARELEQLLVRDPVAAVVTGQRSVLRDVGVKGRDAEAGLVVGAARDVRDRNDAGAALVQLRGRDTTDVPESLNDTGASGKLVTEPPGCLLGDHDDPGAGCLAPEDGAAGRDRMGGGAL